MEPVRYACGTEVRVGDAADFDGDSATVEDVVATAEDQARWGLAVRGIMFRSEKYGLVFEPEDSAAWAENKFLCRASNRIVGRGDL